MSLQHILQTIEAKGKQEADSLLHDANKERIRIENDAKKKAESIKKEAHEILRKKTEAQIVKVEQHASAGMKNKILAAKRDRINRIFTQTYNKLLCNNARMEELCKKLLATLPQGEDGAIIHTGEKTDPIVTANTSIPTTCSLKQEGFTYVGNKVEVDNRLKTLIESVRDETESNVARILFHYV